MKRETFFYRKTAARVFKNVFLLPVFVHFVDNNEVVDDNEVVQHLEDAEHTSISLYDYCHVSYGTVN